MGIVEKLVFADLADGEIPGLGMGEHQTRDAGMGLHGTTLREVDTNLMHIDKLVDHEVQTGVGQ